VTASAVFVRLRSHPAGRYGAAVLATALATWLKLAFPGVIGHGAPVAIYLGVVMLAAWFGGMGPGLLATALFAAAGTYWFAAPYDSFEVEAPHDALRLALAALEGGTIAVLAGALHRATSAAAARAEQLARSNEELHREIEARARAETSLAQTTEQLLHSQKMQALGSLAGGVAHDFNNFLSIIMNYASLLRARLPAGDPSREPLSEIYAAGERAAALTQRLLAFARKANIEPGVLDLNESARGLERMLRLSLGHTIALELRLDPTPTRILADATQVEQVLTNLVLNARDAMPDGGKVTVTTAHITLSSAEAKARGLDGGRYVALTVTDTGTGIPADRIARIFEPFFTTKDVGKGSGLGLSIVHGVVARAGGSVWVESVVGRGTELHVLFPESAEELTKRPVHASGAHDARRSARVLVVEDDAAVRRSTVLVLEQLGYQVRAAARADEALEIWQKEQDTLDIVVTDVAMPAMSGLSLAQELRRRGARVPILFVSGHVRDDEDGAHGNVTGARVIPKPLTPPVLDEALRAALAE
jgi:two-component system, cell cycle sensor histidine kinase and response regulator CckA